MTRIRYEREDDVLTVVLSKQKVDYAEQAGDLIVHFSRKNVPVFVEILNATKFLASVSQTLPEKVKAEVLVSS